MILEKEYISNSSSTHRKKFAQFFTPEPIAEAMVEWLLGNKEASTVLEPAFGLGLFSRKILEKKDSLKITGFDVDPQIFEIAQQNFSTHTKIKLNLEDYLFNDWDSKYDAIVCNPPYLKFHNYNNTETIKEFKRKLNISLSGFTNIYTLFLLKSIYQLKKNGRMAYIVPSEFFNSNYGECIKENLIKSGMLRHIFIFDFKQNIFDKALTTSSILFLANDENSQRINFSTITNQDELENISRIIKDYPNRLGQTSIKKEDVDSSIKWRAYYQKQQGKKYKNLIPFSNVAKTVRGIATGANDYFSFNEEKSRTYKISKENLLTCITKSKDVRSPFFTKQCLCKLKESNANIYLFNGCKKPNQESISYVKIGEENKINERHLTSKRNPWYKLENRPPSPIWVGVFNRNGLKFVRNEAGVSNLTTFHCIYPVDDLFGGVDIELLFAYLLTDVAQQIFNDNRREYGDGLKKFEPNDLNNSMMLDLSKLDKLTKKKIVELYKKYRISALEEKANDEYISTINKILIAKYKA